MHLILILETTGKAHLPLPKKTHANKTVNDGSNIEDHAQLVNAPSPQEGGHNTVGHQGAWPYDWILHPISMFTSTILLPSYYPGYQPFSYPWLQPSMPQAVLLPNTQQQFQLSTWATHTQTGQTTLLEGTQGQAATTAPSQLIQVIGTANTNEHGELLFIQNVATVTKIITQPAQAPHTDSNVSGDLDVNILLNLKGTHLEGRIHLLTDKERLSTDKER